MRFSFVSVLALLVAGCGSDGGSTTPVAAAPSPTPAAPAPAPSASGDVTGCRSVSTDYPWGKAELRQWTPASTTASSPQPDGLGNAFGPRFQARLVAAHGVDLGESRAVAEFEMADGCRRRFATASLSRADVALIEAEVAKRPSAPDPATYRVDFQEGRASQAALDAGTLFKVETQHFAIWYGAKAEGQSNRWLRDQKLTMPAFARDAGAWMERQWLWQRDILGAPMPFASGTDRRKINIYVCGTGLPFIPNGDIEDCGASAADAVWVGAPAIIPGSTTLVHEFGHVIQFYTEGFRDKGDAGPIWELGAEWGANALSPTLLATLPHYLNNLENGPLWSDVRYAATPFFAYLFESDRLRPFFWRAWTQNRRTASGATTEDYLQAYVRLGQEAGTFPNGFASFADDLGWYGARLAGMDFVDQRRMIEAATGFDNLVDRLHVRMTAGSGTGEYLSPARRPLMEFGTHLIPLTPTGSTVEATVTGATTANAAAWRFVIVAVKNGTEVTYSPLGSASGEGSGTIRRAVPADAKLFLAVTATPGTYETLGWQAPNVAPTGTKFPYKLRLTGATAPM